MEPTTQQRPAAPPRPEMPPQVEALIERATQQVDRQPYAAVGVAFVAGYLLSGALLSGTTLRVLLFGGRLLAMPVVQRRVLDALEARP